jgi:hypothetical protein
MTGMASEKQREHIRNYEAQRRAKGWAKATVWLSPEALAALKPLIAAHWARETPRCRPPLSAPPPRQCRTPRLVQSPRLRACKLEGPKARSALKPFQLPYQPETL